MSITTVLQKDKIEGSATGLDLDGGLKRPAARQVAVIAAVDSIDQVAIISQYIYV